MTFSVTCTFVFIAIINCSHTTLKWLTLYLLSIYIVIVSMLACCHYHVAQSNSAQVQPHRATSMTLHS